MGEHATTRRIARGEVGILHRHHDRRRYHTGNHVYCDRVTGHPLDLSADALIHQVEERLPGVAEHLSQRVCLRRAVFRLPPPSQRAGRFAVPWAAHRWGRVSIQIHIMVVLVIGAGLALLASRPQALIVTAGDKRHTVTSCCHHFATHRK